MEAYKLTKKRRSTPAIQLEEFVAIATSVYDEWDTAEKRFKGTSGIGTKQFFSGRAVFPVATRTNLAVSMKRQPSPDTSIEI